MRGGFFKTKYEVFQAKKFHSGLTGQNETDRWIDRGRDNIIAAAYGPLTRVGRIVNVHISSFQMQALSLHDTDLRDNVFSSCSKRYCYSHGSFVVNWTRFNAPAGPPQAGS